MIVMESLPELIKNKKIEFYYFSHKVDNLPHDFGKFEWDLIKKVTDCPANYLTIKGKKLEDFLIEPQNIGDLTGFMVQLWYVKHDLKIHVEADIEKITKKYTGKRVQHLYNGLGEKTKETTNWLKDKTIFERDWNLSLCSAIGGMVGYPGYEWPQNAREFKFVCAEHAERFMIGTKRQLARYLDYGLLAPASFNKIEDNIKNFTLIFSRKQI